MAYVIVFLDFGGISLVSPLVPFYVKEFQDAEGLGFGTANSILGLSYSLSLLVSSPVFGFLSDRFGRRPLLLLSLLGTMGGFAAQGFVTSFWSLAAVRFSTGLLGGSRPVTKAYVGDVVPASSQPTFFALMATTSALSGLLTPIVGGTLGEISLQLPVLVYSGFAAVVLAASVVWLQEPVRRGQGKDRSKRADPPASRSGSRNSFSERASRSGSCTSFSGPVVLRRGLVLANALVGMMAAGILFGLSTLLTILGVDRLGLRSMDLGFIFGGAALGSVLGTVCIFIPLSKRLPLPVVAMLGMSMMVSSVPVLFVFRDRVWSIVFGACINAVGVVLVVPVANVVAIALSPEESRGSVLAFTDILLTIATALFPGVVGPLYDVHAKLPYALFAALGTIAIACLAVISARVRLPGARDEGRQDMMETVRESATCSINAAGVASISLARSKSKLSISEDVGGQEAGRAASIGGVSVGWQAQMAPDYTSTV